MAYRYRLRRSARKSLQKSRTNFIVTLVIIGFLIYATFRWILPSLIGGLGVIRSFVKPSHKDISQSAENASLAPPVLNIPYEATNSAQIDIKGYTSPNSKVKLYLDDSESQTTFVTSDGSFTFQNVTLSLGTNNIFAKTLDEGGKMSLPSKTLRIIYDSEKPKLEVSEPEDGKSIQGERKIKISGKTESESKVFINDTRTIVNSDGTFSSYYELSSGENILTIRAQDLALNETEVIRRVTFSP